MPVKGPENAETARLCVMTLFGEAASVTLCFLGFYPSPIHARSMLAFLLICDDLQTSRSATGCTNASAVDCTHNASTSQQSAAQNAGRL